MFFLGRSSTFRPSEYFDKFKILTMEAKKTPKADLENKKNIFFEIGLTVALAAVLFAFEWKANVSETSDFITVSELPTEPEMVPITVMTQLPPPPPPSVIKPMDILEIVEDIEEAMDEIELIDADDNSENQEVFDFSNIDYGPEDTGDAILPFVPSEDMPIFPGNIQKWIGKNVRYPEIARDNGVQGKVYVQFVVEKDGSVSNITVVRGVDAALDKEAIRVISSMPKWKPGKQRGKPVRVSYTLPIAFQLSTY